MTFSKLLPDLPFPQALLSGIFHKEHERYQQAFPGWSLYGTRRKLAAKYWLQILLKHFGVLFLTGAMLVCLIEHQPFHITLTALIPAALVVFAILFLTMYWPLYQLEFLPHLDSCIENYKGRQLDGINQCKKDQYSVLSLMLIQHVLQELAGIEPVLINSGNVQLLARQHGVSAKSITPALQIISRPDWDKKSIRKRTEITDDFETAKDYFRQLSETKAIAILDKLQQKILQ